MPRKLFVNLAVKDLKTSVDFFTRLGFEFNKQFTGDKATCMIVNDDACVMLLTEAYFATFTKKSICDTKTTTETLLCLSADSRDDVDALVKKALAAGGQPANDPTDHGVMYGWSFQDPDGHTWEVMWMDPSAFAS